MSETSIATLPRFVVHDVVVRALSEDLGRGDLTTDACVPRETTGEAALVARMPLVCAGLAVFRAVFGEVDPDLEVTFEADDGDRMEAGARVGLVRGAAGSILKGERVALNFVQRMSGVATKTRALVDALPAGSRTRIADTRKTTPGLRALEKYAVRVGGGTAHRYGLDDAVLVKDNHVALAGGIAEAVLRVRRSVGHLVKVEVEVDTLAQLDDALAIGVDAVLLDNMDLPTLREAVRRARGRALTEASGGIRPENVREVAETGVDLVSLGWITHSAPSLDVALDVEA